MSNLEEYIRENTSQLDTALPPEGTQEQFLLRWETGRKRQRLFYYAVSAAAALALLLALQPWNSFRGTGSHPDAVYQRYMALAAEAWEDVAADEQASAALLSLTEEAVPLLEQLPEELSPREQAAILRAYYGDLLAGVDKVKKTVNY